MQRAASFLLGAAVAAAIAALLFWRAPGDGDEVARWRERAYEAERRLAELRDRPPWGTPEPGRPIASSPQRAAEPIEAADAPADAAPERDARLDPAWDPIVRGELRTRVQQRLGRALAPEQEARLLERLEAVRRAGVALDAEESDDEDARRRQRLERSIVLLEADRAFREELGFGLGEFLSDLDDGGQVEDLAGARSAPEDAAGPAPDAASDPPVTELP